MKSLIIAALLVSTPALAGDFVPAGQPLCKTTGKFAGAVQEIRKEKGLSADKMLAMLNTSNPAGKETNAMATRWAYGFGAEATPVQVWDAIEKRCLDGKLSAR
jgi:hypothetical protein